MARCEVCNNEYDKTFTVTTGGQEHVFDSFECAIHALAPICPHCGCRVIGHGVEQAGTVFCCVNCAEHEGVKGLKDRSRSRAGRKRFPVGRAFAATPDYVIQRASESRCEWWTGRGWSGNESEALHFPDKPSPSAVTGDESADVELVEA
jgi:hypothetical protein